MIPSICIFEDNTYSRLYPLSLTRPVFDLQCGMVSLKEKIIRQFPGVSVNLFCRKYLKDLVQQQNPSYTLNKIKGDSSLFINGRMIMDSHLREIFDIREEVIFINNNQVMGAFLKGENLSEFINVLEKEAEFSSLDNIPLKEIKEVRFINYCWDLVHQNPFEIENDFTFFNQGGKIKGKVSQQAVLVNKSNIYIGKEVVIKPGVVLDAEQGSIYIDQGAEIMPNAVIQGPCYIGKKSKVKIGTKIYQGTSIGEFCKVGGEVEESIIHSFSNKQHDGYLGHAYLGQWVNIGAGTNNSDLKNNYSSVKVYVKGEFIDSGSMFVGLTMGDHSKTGINTMFNTGTVVGVMCNIFGADFPPKFIPSFSWGSAKEMMEHTLDKALQTARLVMARRDQQMTPEYESMLKYVHELTKSNRKL
jgi:UDP-N-acetylglucosamine diphosphorylase/glucosamine-1-phosphate N-acetyltransferase